MPAARRRARTAPSSRDTSACGSANSAAPTLPQPIPDAEIRSFADAIRRAGGLDLCVLGIGVNGHIAFNEPGSAVDSRARAVELEPASRAAHAASFGSLDRVPSTGMTLGVADLLESRRILVIAEGEKKASIVREAIRGPEGPEVPATWLRRHPDVTWLLDAAAAAQLES